MFTLRFARFFGLVLLLTVSMSASGQWRIVAPNLTSVSTYHGGICVRNGIVWMASGALYKSTDSGVTWTRKSLPEDPFDLDFYDSLHGIFPGTYNAWVTSDGGTTWQVLLSAPSASACFLNSPNAMAVAERLGAYIAVTTDNGNSWANNLPAQENTFCVRYTNGIIYEDGGTPPGGSFLHTSTDFGQSWQRSVSGYDEESYCFAIDSCEPSRIYIAHEDEVHKTDSNSKIFLTTDAGITWQTKFSHHEPFFSGSIAEGRSAVYCQTSSNGVFRSTDQGETWTSIGGPSVTFDTRLVAAISDNIILALDDAGNVWRTDNSGGDSVPESFTSETIVARPLTARQNLCGVPVDTQIKLSIPGCRAHQGILDSAWVSGRGFQISDLRHTPRSLSLNDSIRISYSTLTGSDTGELHLRMVLDSGIKDTIIPIFGIFDSPLLADAAQAVRASAAGYFGQFDSLPMAVSIGPTIRIDSLWPYITDIEGTYQWDTSVASYYAYEPPVGWLLSSINWNGNSVDFKIRNRSSLPSTSIPLGIAIFQPTNTSLATTWVTMTSLELTIAGKNESLCVTDNEDNHWSLKTLGAPNSVSELPNLEFQLSLYPNPANGNVWMSSNQDLGPATIEIYDLLGIKLSEQMSSLSKRSPVELLLPRVSGVYTVRVRSAEGTQVLSLVRE